MRFQRDGNALVCGTENGYIAVFKLKQNAKEMEQRMASCLHRGSVEGLEVDRNGRTVSVASDCTIVVLQINEKLMDETPIQSLL